MYFMLGQQQLECKTVSTSMAILSHLIRKKKEKSLKLTMQKGSVVLKWTVFWKEIRFEIIFSCSKSGDS